MSTGDGYRDLTQPDHVLSNLAGAMNQRHYGEYRRLIDPDFEEVSARKFTWFSFLVSSALFGALHGRWLAGALAGMLYAWAVYRRGRIGDAIVAHAVTQLPYALVAAGISAGLYLLLGYAL